MIYTKQLFAWFSNFIIREKQKSGKGKETKNTSVHSIFIIEYT